MTYIVPGLIVWLIAAVVIYLIDRNEDALATEGESWFLATTFGLIAGIAWPLTILSGCMFLLARSVVRKLEQTTKRVKR